MLFESKQEQQIVNNFLLRNNFFINNLVSQDKIIAFLKKINVYQTELIRLGSNNDGGYLVPNDLKGISACFSPGVDTKIEFFGLLFLMVICLHFSIRISALTNQVRKLTQSIGILDLEKKTLERQIKHPNWRSESSNMEQF